MPGVGTVGGVLGGALGGLVGGNFDRLYGQNRLRAGADFRRVEEIEEQDNKKLIW